MRSEILQLKGLIADSERQEKIIDAKCKGSIFLIRNLLNPYEDDITKIETEQVLEGAKALHEDKTELEEIRNKIRRMKADLV